LIPLTATCSSLPSPSSKPYPAPPPCRRRPIFYPLHKRLQGKTSRKVQKIQNFQSPSSPKKDRRRTTVPRRRSPRRVRGWSCRGVLVLYAEGQERKLLQDDATDLAVAALFLLHRRSSLASASSSSTPPSPRRFHLRPPPGWALRPFPLAISARCIR
jgi:hypothetical protein